MVHIKSARQQCFDDLLSCHAQALNVGSNSPDKFSPGELIILKKMSGNCPTNHRLYLQVIDREDNHVFVKVMGDEFI